MQPLLKRLDALSEIITSAMIRLDVVGKQQIIETLEAELSVPEVWNNPIHAQVQTKKLAQLKSIVEPWFIIKAQVEDFNELIAIGDDELLTEFDQQIAALEASLEKMRKELLFDGEFDGSGAILRLSAGVGGTDAQDWTEMLERMYLRWADKEGATTKIIERSTGEEAGLKSVIIEVEGAYAYGKLKSEHGVHRLVRLSPFNADNLRQTSFALVEVLPQMDEQSDIKIDDKDLKIDVYRAGGHGGQSVNTTDSAVRITHIPTGIIVAIQNERSQLQNKDTAMKILRSKLAQMQLEQRAQSVSELQAGESANWGSQIRNYVLHPYTLVKDTRTKHETNNAQDVLDGDINQFIYAYLESPQHKS